MKRLTPTQLKEIQESKGSPVPMMLKYNITKSYVYRIRRDHSSLLGQDHISTSRDVVISEHGSDPDPSSPKTT